MLLHASDGQCAGCEIENIALRNTAAYAACRHDKLPQVGVWAGVCCGHVTEDSLRNCPCPCDEDDGAGDEGGDDQHEDQQRTRARKTAHHTEWTQRRDAKLTEIQDHFYRLKAKLASSAALCKDSKDKEDFFERAEKVDSHILAAFQELNDVPDLPQSTVANRFRSDPKRGQRPKTPPTKRADAPPQKRPAANGGSAAVPTTPASHTAASPRHVVIVLSDSDDERELRNGGASSSD